MAKKKDEDPGLIYVAVAVGILVFVFSLFHYFRFSSKYARPGTQRVFDIAGAFQSLVSSAGVIAVVSVSLYALHAKYAWPMWGLLLLSLPVLNWAGKAQALAFLGVVVDSEKGFMYYPPTLTTLSFVQWLAVYPLLARLTSPTWIPIGAIESMTKQAGKRLFLHGDFGSIDLNFSSKLKRDECIHIIRSAKNGNVQPEGEYEYADVDT